jgi:hypothetical protein
MLIAILVPAVIAIATPMALASGGSNRRSTSVSRRRDEGCDENPD